MMRALLSGCLLLGSLLIGAVGSAAATPDPIATMRDRSRVLVVSAPSADDPLLLRQRQVFAAMAAGARERDLVIVEVLGDADDARRLRTRHALDPAAFQAVLIGKDGGAKLRSAMVLGPHELFPTIDAMPMRQEEMRRRGHLSSRDGS